MIRMVWMIMGLCMCQVVAAQSTQSLPVVERQTGIGIKGMEIGMTVAEARRVAPPGATFIAKSTREYGTTRVSALHPIIYNLQISDVARLKRPGDYTRISLWTMPPSAGNAADESKDRIVAFLGSTQGIVERVGGPQGILESQQVPIKALVSHYEKLYGPVQSAYTNGSETFFIFHPGRPGTAWNGNWAELPMASQMMEMRRVCADGVELTVTAMSGIINPRPHDPLLQRADQERNFGKIPLAALEKCGKTVVMMTNYLALHDQQAGMTKDHVIRGADVSIYTRSLR